jgi:hypothetical protein
VHLREEPHNDTVARDRIDAPTKSKRRSIESVVGRLHRLARLDVGSKSIEDAPAFLDCCSAARPMVSMPSPISGDSHAER